MTHSTEVFEMLKMKALQEMLQMLISWCGTAKKGGVARGYHAWEEEIASRRAFVKKGLAH
jgi:hypothetical protein